MRGRPGCPTGQEKKPVGATAGRAPFSTRKGWVQDRPLIRPGFAGPPSPRGEGFGGGKNPSRLRNHLPQPAQPGGGPLRTLDYGPQARQKRRRTPAGSPQPEKVGPGRKNLFLPGVLSSGFLPKKAGPPPGAGRGNGALRPEAPEKPRPPEGYAVPLARPPAPPGGYALPFLATKGPFSPFPIDNLYSCGRV